MNIKDTPVYKYNAPMIRKQDREEFARMLELALGSDAELILDNVKLKNAFVWFVTPQGHAYWQELARRIEEYLS